MPFAPLCTLAGRHLQLELGLGESQHLIRAKQVGQWGSGMPWDTVGTISAFSTEERYKITWPMGDEKAGG